MSGMRACRIKKRPNSDTQKGKESTGNQPTARKTKRRKKEIAKNRDKPKSAGIADKHRTSINGQLRGLTTLLCWCLCLISPHLVPSQSFLCQSSCFPVGLEIDVLWPDDGTWYRAHVTAIRSGRKEKIKIDYVEGTVEWVEKSKFVFNKQWRYPQALTATKTVADSVVIAPQSGPRQLS